MAKEYMNFLKSIKGKYLSDIGRAADMCWVIFNAGMLLNGKEEEISLHIQTPWRIRHKHKIILSCYQMYEPNTLTEYSEDFEWDIAGNNLFDEMVRKNLNKINNMVESVKITSLNDLSVTFSNEYILEIFNAGSEYEIWRLFEHNETHIKQHLVAYGNGAIGWE